MEDKKKLLLLEAAAWDKRDGYPKAGEKAFDDGHGGYDTYREAVEASLPYWEEVEAIPTTMQEALAEWERALNCPQ